MALDAYEDGLSNIPVKFHAHLLAAESRVLVQLRRFDDAVKKAQGAIERYSGHVSNHLALALRPARCPAVAGCGTGCRPRYTVGRLGWKNLADRHRHFCAGV